MSTDQSKTLEGGLELTVVKFEPLRAYTMLGRFKSLENRYLEDTQFMVDMLSGSFVIRTDDGQKSNVSLGGTGGVNRGFSGFGMETMIDALNFALEVNFGSFFAYGERKVATARANAATKGLITG